MGSLDNGQQHHLQNLQAKCYGLMAGKVSRAALSNEISVKNNERSKAKLCIDIDSRGPNMTKLILLLWYFR